jgi:hypothetical protein
MTDTIQTGVSNTQEKSVRPFPCKETISVVVRDTKISCCNRMGTFPQPVINYVNHTIQYIYQFILAVVPTAIALPEIEKKLSQKMVSNTVNPRYEGLG